MRELLRRTRAASRATASHEDVPFGAIVKEVQPERGHEPPAAGASAAQLRAAAAGRRRRGGRSCICDMHHPTSKFDLCLEVDERAERLTGRLHLQQRSVRAETIGRMIGHWRMVLEGMVARTGRPVGGAGAAGRGGDGAAAGGVERGRQRRELTGPSISELIADRRRRGRRRSRWSARESS